MGTVLSTKHGRKMNNSDRHGRREYDFVTDTSFFQFGLPMPTAASPFDSSESNT